MIKTDKQFREFLKEAAQDTIADGHNLDECAGDIADCLWYDDDLKKYVLKKHPWIKTKQQWREFIADYLVA